jgi:hypothetical protein
VEVGRRLSPRVQAHRRQQRSATGYDTSAVPTKPAAAKPIFGKIPAKDPLVAKPASRRRDRQGSAPVAGARIVTVSLNDVVKRL